MAAGETAELAQVRVVNWGSPSTKSQSAGLAGLQCRRLPVVDAELVLVCAQNGRQHRRAIAARLA